jgi:hypothetical protein
MRSGTEFTAAYRKALESVDPSKQGLGIERIRSLAQTELCLAFLEGLSEADRWRMQGRNRDGPRNDPPPMHSIWFGLSWLDATAQYQRTTKTIRCYDIATGRAIKRKAAPEVLHVLLAHRLAAPVGWAESKLQIADPGEDRGRQKLAYNVPAVSAEQRVVNKHVLTRRDANAPIRVTYDELIAIAGRIDDREAQASWPKGSLPPLSLTARLKRLRLKDLGGFFDGKTFTLDGAMHVVGMLSSGKSTLVLALIFALTLGRSGKRIALIVSDTIQGATLASRLRRHGIKATVLASLGNRT